MVHQRGSLEHIIKSETGKSSFVPVTVAAGSPQEGSTREENQQPTHSTHREYNRSLLLSYCQVEMSSTQIQQPLMNTATRDSKELRRAHWKTWIQAKKEPLSSKRTAIHMVRVCPPPQCHMVRVCPSPLPYGTCLSPVHIFLYIIYIYIYIYIYICLYMPI